MRKHIILLAVLFLSITALSCQTESTYTNLSPLEFQQAMGGEGLLLDVRTPGEFSQMHIEGALLIPLQELEQRIEEISDYKDKPVWVYCRSGNRSLSAISILQEQGFSELYNLSSGISGWTQQGLPVE